MYDRLKKELLSSLEEDTSFTKPQIQKVSDFIDDYVEKYVFTETKHPIPMSPIDFVEDYTLSNIIKSVYYDIRTLYYKILSIIRSCIRLWF